MRRTDQDFSKHILETITDEHITVYDLHLPDRAQYKRVIFMIAYGVTSVIGDYGNWIFNRAFYPGKENHVSDGYWLEKLKIASEQDGEEFDVNATEEEILNLIDHELEECGFEGKELDELREYYNELLPISDMSEHEYLETAHMNLPSQYDSDMIPYVKSTKWWLQVVFDAFDEICNRMEKENEK